MIWLIAYDISDNRARKKIADLLIQYGFERIQLSVFIGHILPYKKEELYGLLQPKVNPLTDRIIMIRITENQINNCVSLGNDIALTSIFDDGNVLYF